MCALRVSICKHTYIAHQKALSASCSALLPVSLPFRARQANDPKRHHFPASRLMVVASFFKLRVSASTRLLKARWSKCPLLFSSAVVAELVAWRLWLFPFVVVVVVSIVMCDYRSHFHHHIIIISSSVMNIIIITIITIMIIDSFVIIIISKSSS